MKKPIIKGLTNLQFFFAPIQIFSIFRSGLVVLVLLKNLARRKPVPLENLTKVAFRGHFQIGQTNDSVFNLTTEGSLTI